MVMFLANEGPGLRRHVRALPSPIEGEASVRLAVAPVIVAESATRFRVAGDAPF